jgi:hypothetical protein
MDTADTVSRFWISRPAALTLLSCSKEFLRVEIAPRLPADAVRQQSGRGHPVLFYAPALVRAALERVEELSAPAAGSPALERYRTARAEREELELASRRNQLVARDKVTVVLTRIGEILRGVGDRLREHGDGPREVFNSGLDACLVAVAELCKDGASDGHDNQAGQPAA